MKLISFERQVNQDLYYAILKKGFGFNTDIEHLEFENNTFKDIENLINILGDDNE